MKAFVASIIALSLTTACQQTQQKPATTGNELSSKPRLKYRVIILSRGKYSNIDYQPAIKDFEAEVNQAIAEGWQPLGSVASLYAVPMQAMIKEE